MTQSFMTQHRRTFLLRLLNTNSHLSLVRDINHLRKKLISEIDKVHNLPVVQAAVDTRTSEPRGARGARKEAPVQDKVVGFEDEMKTLISYLLEDSDELEFISIIGMPGLGKTTVARKIYSHPDIQSEFPNLIWICVSYNFNKKDVLLTILKNFTDQDMSSHCVDDLDNLVRKHLEREKFLIFLDDVWTNDVLRKLHSILPKRNKNSKVLITSRVLNVARQANRKREPHRLRFLNEKESWDLLQLQVFGMLNKVPPELETIGKSIASQCGGLPFAIVLTGGILYDTLSESGDTKKEWIKVHENLQNYLSNGDEWMRMQNIISWSYEKLPYDLRDCFLYLGIFPEYSEISAWKLTQLWIVEGFIQEKGGKSLEEIAQDYLEDLINRNLVLVGKTKLNGEVKTCLLHHTIHAFCQKIAGHQDQGLFEAIKRSNEGYFEPSDEIIQKCRRFCIHSYVEEFFQKKLKVPRARSFLCFSNSPLNLENKDIPSITDPFELLRILDASTIMFPKFPHRVTNLIHLRYLSLSVDELIILPDAISKLWNLQTLTVYTQSRTFEVKASIWDMMQLRHVKTKASMILLEKGGKGKGGESLQTLGRLSPQSCTEDVFNKAKNLKTLGICGKLDTLVYSNLSEKLECLEKLKLINVFPRVASENPLPCLPCTFPTKLRILTLSSTYLDWKHMSAVGNIPNLELLKLKDNAFVGDTWDVSVGGFHQLECLCISRTDLTTWTVSGDSFPKLRSLVLKHCEKLEGVPFDLWKNLEMLSMEQVTGNAITSARKIEQAKKDLEGKQRNNSTGGFKLIISSE